MSIIILLLSLCEIILTIKISIERRNISIDNSSYFSYHAKVQKYNEQLIHNSASLNHSVQSIVPSSGNYFDFFYYLTESDMNCFNKSLHQDQYLYPCPFLSTNYTQLRTTQTSNANLHHPTVELIKNINYSYVIDNTPIPFLQGAYCYQDLAVNVRTDIQIKLTDTIQILAQRLIWINITVLLIYIATIVYLWYSIRRINKKIGQSTDKTIIGHNSMKKHDDLQSVDDNYSMIIGDNSQEICHSTLLSSQRSHSLIQTPPSKARKSYNQL